MSLRNMKMSDHEDCLAVREVLNRVGDKWSVLVIAVLGEGPKRFNELKRMIEGISQRMLTLTLRGLERDGVVSSGFKDALNGFANATIVVDRCDDHIRRRHQDVPFCMHRIVRTARTLG